MVKEFISIQGEIYAVFSRFCSYFDARIFINAVRQNKNYRRREHCQSEMSRINQSFLSQFQFRFDATKCLWQMDDHRAVLNQFYTKALPSIVFAEDADYADWASCDTNRSQGLAAYHGLNGSTGLEYLCMEKDSFLDDGFVGYVLATGDQE